MYMWCHTLLYSCKSIIHLRNGRPLILASETFAYPYLSTGPPLPKSRFVVAVNWNSILFVDGRDKKLLELPYLELKEVRMIRYG